MLTDADALWEAAERLEVEGAWQRHSMGTSGTHCAVGWIARVNGFEGFSMPLSELEHLPGVRPLGRYLHNDGYGNTQIRFGVGPYDAVTAVAEWNDLAGRTQQEVVDTMRRVSKELREIDAD